jgi:hypothetical protein
MPDQWQHLPGLAHLGAKSESRIKQIARRNPWSDQKNELAW